MTPALLRRLTIVGIRKGMGGSRGWFVIGLAATGARVIYRMSRRDQEVLFRTAIKAGDIFEIISSPRPK
jgi:hypothetical protein